MLSAGIAPSGLLIWEQFRHLLLTLPPSWRSKHFAHESARQGKEGLAELLFSKGNEVMSLFAWNYSLSAMSSEKVTLLRKEKTADERSLKVPWMFACFLLCQQCRMAVALCELVVGNFITLSVCFLMDGKYVPWD